MRGAKYDPRCWPRSEGSVEVALKNWGFCDIYEVFRCECGHTRNDHRFTPFYGLSSMRCRGCACTTYKEQPPMTETVYSLHQAQPLNGELRSFSVVRRGDDTWWVLEDPTGARWQFDSRHDAETVAKHRADVWRGDPPKAPEPYKIFINYSVTRPNSAAPSGATRYEGAIEARTIPEALTSIQVQLERGVRHVEAAK